MKINLVKKQAGYFIILLLLNACATSSGILQEQYFKKRETQYRVGVPGKYWKRLYMKGTDLAWINNRQDSTILVNSQCKDVKDSSLIALTVQLLIGMTDQNIESQTTKAWSQREALETILTAKIDGVSRKLAIFVLKKDGCIYDIVFAAPPQTFDIEVVDYQALLNQFDVGNRSP